jgi:zinc transporter ZupT
MIHVLLIFQAVLVMGIVLFTLGFLITSLKENEMRAAMMAGVLSGIQRGPGFQTKWLHTSRIWGMQPRPITAGTTTFCWCPPPFFSDG